MSTFNGLVSEFPDIRIDFFRRHPDAEPPLACFLSHVHSDHLAGLESLRSPFVYCSAATREILLKLERYPCRINYAKGILESRQQTYKHLAKVLKPLPLETPTTIELRPGHQVQVTLFDANHCLGAVMFLIEGNGRAILYTGDIRSEPWFVTSLARSPSLVEYTCGIKTLDKIYLDTSFTDDVPFQTKAEGIAELLRKVSHYPADTVFHIQAWTYGYEDVWVALSKALNSPIHVDDYKLRIYGSLKARTSTNRFDADIHMTPESPALTGYMCGNAPHPGCLTADQNVRLHSCEKGNMCEIARRSSTVRIQPVIAHLPGGEDLAEVGVGGGGDDLEREAELEHLDQASLESLLDFICSSDDVLEKDHEDIKKYLTQVTFTGRNISLDIDGPSLDQRQSARNAVKILANKLLGSSNTKTGLQNGPLPKTIRFPYSRHSSYPELCGLVNAFKPRDIWPCTVNPAEWMHEGISIDSLFGKYCSGEIFEHDIRMQAIFEQQAAIHAWNQADSQTTTSSAPLQEPSPTAPRVRNSSKLSQQPSLSRTPSREPDKGVRLVSPLEDTQFIADPAALKPRCIDLTESQSTEGNREEEATCKKIPVPSSQKRRHDDFAEDSYEGTRHDDSQYTDRSCSSVSPARHSKLRHDAYLQMLQNAANDDWQPIGLISTTTEHFMPEQEL